MTDSINGKHKTTVRTLAQSSIISAADALPFSRQSDAHTELMRQIAVPFKRSDVTSIGKSVSASSDSKDEILFPAKLKTVNAIRMTVQSRIGKTNSFLLSLKTEDSTVPTIAIDTIFSIRLKSRSALSPTQTVRRFRE